MKERWRRGRRVWEGRCRGGRSGGDAAGTEWEEESERRGRREEWEETKERGMIER